MHYIIFDMEFNQDFSQENNNIRSNYFEIIQIGAIKLDDDYNTISTFNRFIKPTFYTSISPFITTLTGITTKQLETEETFSKVYHDFLMFINDVNSCFCVWGMSDIKVLFKNVMNFKLEDHLLPKNFIDIQPLLSSYLQIPKTYRLRLQHAVEILKIPSTKDYHNAFHDAYYTAEIFKKIYSPSIKPQVYDPNYVPVKPKQRKKEIDVESLIRQFEKMYEREMTEEEKSMILLSYKMGKTNQFLK